MAVEKSKRGGTGAEETLEEGVKQMKKSKQPEADLKQPVRNEVPEETSKKKRKKAEKEAKLKQQVPEEMPEDGNVKKKARKNMVTSLTHLSSSALSKACPPFGTRWKKVKQADLKQPVRNEVPEETPDEGNLKQQMKKAKQPIRNEVPEETPEEGNVKQQMKKAKQSVRNEVPEGTSKKKRKKAEKEAEAEAEAEQEAEAEAEQEQPVINEAEQSLVEEESEKKKTRRKRMKMLSYIRKGKIDKLFKEFLPPKYALSEQRTREAADYISRINVPIIEILELHKQIGRCFTGLTAEEARAQLSNPELSTKLVLPTLRRSQYGPHKTYTYVGRTKFSKLLSLITPGCTSMAGYPGRGKSYLMAAMACYLHAYEEEHEPVVYIQTTQLVGNFRYLVDALLLAYVRHPEKQVEILACAADSEQLLNFCRAEEPLVFMDEVNALDVNKESAGSSQKQRELAASWRKNFFHRGVSCASYSSTYLRDDRHHNLRLDDAFDETELASWACTNGIPAEDYRELIFHTALVPRFLQEYTADREHFSRERLKFLRTYLRSIVSPEEILRARRILNGFEYSLVGLNTDIFVMRSFGSNDVVSVLPFLEEELRGTLDERRTEAELVHDLELFTSRKIAFQRAMKGDSERGVQPVAALNGLLAEWIARECVVLHKECLGWRFKSCVVYHVDSHGEIEDLRSTSLEALKAGVCFVPFSSQAKHADLHVVQLTDGNVFVVHSVQMSVSAWSRKKQEDSHTEWAKSVQQIWDLGTDCTVQADFTYVLSNALRSSISETVTIKKFEDMHPLLAFIDELKDPEVEPKFCMGTNKDGSSCRRFKRTGGDYYCKDHHPVDAT